jgi:hypothetical protein
MNVPKRLLSLAPLALALAGATVAAHAQTAPTLESLAAQVKALSEEVRQAGATASRQQVLINQLRTSNDSLVARLSCVAAVSGTRDFIFDGCNVHVRNGAGSGGGINRYGNLIIGYNKNEVAIRDGSHNLVMGSLNEYRSSGGIVGGSQNSIMAPDAVVLGGGESIARGSGIVLGASRAVADSAAVIIGGTRSYTAPGASFSVVVGGRENTSSGTNAVAIAGAMNEASGGNALACGGSENKATGTSSTACGGSRNKSQASDSVVTGGSQNSADGLRSTVSGGLGCSTGAVNNKWAVGTAVNSGCSAFAN